MNYVQSPTTRPLSAPDYHYQLARRCWVVSFVMVSATYWLTWQPGHALIGAYRVLPGPVAVAASAAFAYGLAAVAALALRNRKRWKTVLWPIWGKLLGAFALAFVTPIAVISGFPWILGANALIATSVSTGIAFWGLAILLIGTLLWYPIAALIICGTRSKWLRFGLFCLMFWSSYAAHLLYSGVNRFVL